MLPSSSIPELVIGSLDDAAVRGAVRLLYAKREN
jgi:hypothetical protein